MSSVLQLRSATVALALITVASAVLWWPSDYLLDIPSDDSLLMTVNRRVLNGERKELFAPQDVHVVPLFRLVRLPFELDFPFRFRWLQLISIAAHAASTVLLFALCRRSLHTSWAAVAAAALFAWRGIGGAAFIVKAHSSYVLSLPFLLGALYCLCHFREDSRRGWATGCFVCLLAAIGFHSLLAVLAIPGILVGHYMLARGQACPGLGADAPAWLACGVPFITGCLVWQIFCGANREIGSGLHIASTGLLTWIWEICRGVILHAALLVGGAVLSPSVLAAGALALIVLLVRLRNEPSLRLILTLAALAGPPLMAALALRGGQQYETSRYFYQSFAVAATLLGSGVDEVVWRIKRQDARRATALALVGTALVYYQSQRSTVRRMTLDLLHTQNRPVEFWTGWARFFDYAASRSAPLSGFRLAPIEMRPHVPATDVFGICNPRGRTGIDPVAPGDTRIQDCDRFWQALQSARKLPHIFKGLSIPESLVILGSHETRPAGDHLICRAMDR